MCDMRLARVKKDELVKYSCTEVHEKKDEWIKEATEMYGKNELKRSYHPYDHFLESMVDFLFKCKDRPYEEVLESFPKQDRMEIAKIARKLGLDPWKKEIESNQQ